MIGEEITGTHDEWIIDLSSLIDVWEICALGDAERPYAKQTDHYSTGTGNACSQGNRLGYM